jgi:hypothetical protein
MQADIHPTFQQQHSSVRASHHPRWLLAAFWISVAISIAVVVRRLIELIRPSHSGPPQMAGMDTSFASHAALTMAHIIPAAIFVVVASIVLLRRSRSEWLERLFFSLGVITGLTAYAMSVYSIGGWIERSAVLVFDTWFLFGLGRAWRFKTSGDTMQERNWITRAVGTLLSIATTRPVMGVFFATSSLTHLAPNQFFGVAFWIGFSINTIGVELWVRSRRRAQLHSAISG